MILRRQIVKLRNVGSYRLSDEMPASEEREGLGEGAALTKTYPFTQEPT
jgi:hypothetical protein